MVFPDWLVDGRHRTPEGPNTGRSCTTARGRDVPQADVGQCRLASHRPRNVSTPYSVEKQNAMNEENTAPTMPDRLSVDPRSPHHIAAVFERDIGIRLNGKERSDVEEYCISEGWVRVPAGKAIDRKGHPLMIKLKGTVEAYYK